MIWLNSEAPVSTGPQSHNKPTSIENEWRH